MNLIDVKHFSKISFFILFVIIVTLSLIITSNFLLAIIGGAFLAQLFKPLQDFLIKNKINSTLSAYLILFFFIIVTIIPTYFFIQKLIIEISKLTQLISSSNISYLSISNKLKESSFFNYFISDASSLDSHLIVLVKFIIETTQSFIFKLASQMPSLIIDTIFILLSLFVFLLNGEKIKTYISNLIPLHEYIKKGLIFSSNEIFKFAFLASFLAAIGQSAIILLGFLILNIPNAVLASGTAFIFAFIPLVGSVPICLAGVIYLFFTGSIFSIIVMIIIGILTSFIDNLIRALVLKRSVDKLHPFIGLISIIGGMQIFGVLGMLIGPIIATLLLSMCKAWPEVLAYRTKK